jgi:hypothetical protein
MPTHFLLGVQQTLTEPTTMTCEVYVIGQTDLQNYPHDDKAAPSPAAELPIEEAVLFRPRLWLVSED